MSSSPSSSPESSNSSNSTNIKAQDSKETFHYGNTLVNYTLVKSKRRKTCEVIVEKNRGTIIVRVPFEKNKEEIEKILNDKIRWAITKQKEYGDEIKEISKPTYENNSTLPYLGKNYELQIVTCENFENEKTVDSEHKEKITFTDGKFFAYLFKERKDNDNNDNEGEALHKEKTRKLYNEWLISEANKIFVDKVNQYSKLVDAIPKRIIIKDLKNRWGSLTKNESLHLNFNLIKASEDIIDYIIIHELCHLKIKGHSYHFWNYLKQFVPDYPEKIKWLERNSVNILP